MHQKMRYDRDILTSGVTVISRESTRHRNAAEQTLLEQKLNDLDLQRRRSIQAINSEQEKSRLKFLKTKGSNSAVCGASKPCPRKGSLDISKTSQASKSVLSRSMMNSQSAKSREKTPGSNSNQLLKARSKSSTNSGTKGKVQEEISSLYDDYLSYTPSFLLEEYEREANLAGAQGKCSNSNSSIENKGDDFEDVRPQRVTTHLPQTISDQELAPPRPRAKSLHVFSEAFPQPASMPSQPKADVHMLESNSPPTKLLPHDIPSASKLALVHEWRDTAMGDSWSQSRRRSICTDKLEKTFRGYSAQEPGLSHIIQRKNPGPAMCEVRRTLYRQSHSTKNDAGTIEEDRGDRHSLPDNMLRMRRESYGRQPLLRRGVSNADSGHRKNSDRSDSRKSSSDFNDGNIVSTLNRHDSIPEDDAEKIFRDIGKSSSGRDMCRNHSIQSGNSIQDGSRKNSIQDGSRKNSFQDGSRKNSIQDGSRKNSIQDGSRKNSIQDTKRKYSFENNNTSDTNKTSWNTGKDGTQEIERDNMLGDLHSEDDTDNCHRKNTMELNLHDDINMSTDIDETSNMFGDEETLALCVEGGKSMMRDRTMLKKVLLEASAKQLTSCLNKLAEKNESDATEKQSLPIPPRLTPRSSIDDDDGALVGETTANCPKEVSFHDMPDHIRARRPSVKGNFFHLANAFKSGQVPGEARFRPSRQCRRSISSIPSDHPCALADYKSRTTSVKRLADAHQALQNSALRMVEKDSQSNKSCMFA
ncbi:hypothetical protein EGW08_009020 [Elysia chlorotica]|uniref:Uncharacterized protein n=1 Tax=Elysia chlorotica TaxID=188477 RepID=A0A3S0ZQ84_ELYCH|nr:hypothetical protein EGW08_009020 [Elysia chlorotica]